MTIHERSTMGSLFEPFPTILEVPANIDRRDQLLTILADEVIQPSYISRVRVEGAAVSNASSGRRPSTSIFFTCTFPLSLELRIHPKPEKGEMTLRSPCCSAAIGWSTACSECNKPTGYGGDAVELAPSRHAVLQADGTSLDLSGYNEMHNVLEATFRKIIPQVDPMAVAMASQELQGILLNVLERFIKA